MADRFAPGRVLASRWFNLALAGLVMGVALIELLTRAEHTNPATGALAVVVLGSAVAIRRSRPVVAAGLLAAARLATASYGEDFLPVAGVATASILAYSCGAHASRRSGLGAVAVLAVCLQIAMGFADFPNFEILFVTLGPWWVGLQVDRRRRLAQELRERTVQLEAEQDTFARLSVRRERP